MTTYKRICIKDHTITDSEGTSFTIARGKEYITSDVNKKEEVMVFSTYWVWVPANLFAGEILFTA